MDRVQQKIAEQFKFTIARSTAHREMKKPGLAYITPRP
ncbi:helix-turn-helix domain-containing protein [Holospora undulata]